MSMATSNDYESPDYGNEIRHLQKFHDIIIRVGDRTFPCHRVILASKLEYFRNMFCGEYDEADKKEVELKGINADDFELLLTHIYGGPVSFKDDNIYRLLRISNYLCLQNLSNLCEEYILNNSESIPVKTVASIFMFASKVGKDNLIDKLVKRVAQNFTIVFQEEDLFHISPVELGKILSHPDLDRDLTTMLDFVTNWTKYHTDEKKVLDDVLGKIGLEHKLKEWFMKKLMETIVPPSQYTMNEESGDIHNGDNDSGKLCLFVDEDIDNIKTSSVQKSQSELPFHFYYCVCKEDTYSVHQYKLDNSNTLQFVRCLLKSSSLNSKTFCKSVFFNKNHYIVQCEYSTYPKPCITIIPHLHDNNEKYYPMSSTCMTKPGNALEMEIETLGSGIYVYNYGEFVMFNCESNQWIELTNSAHFKTMYPNLVSHGNCLYLIGGARMQNIDTTPKEKLLKDTIVYTEENCRFFQYCDIREGIWKQLPNMTFGHNMSASSIYKDILYVSGGESLRGCVESYDFKAGKWNAFETQMPVSKKCHVQFSYDNKLWFFGGSDSTWYFYDLEEKVWSNIFPKLVLTEDQPNVLLDAEVQFAYK